jgi:hypothetical protein
VALLINDTTQTTTAVPGGPRFSVKRGDVAVLRSTNLDGSAVISLFYMAPDGKSLGPSTDDTGTAVTLTPTNPERMVNVPGLYTVEVTTASNTQGVVFVSQ